MVPYTEPTTTTTDKEVETRYSHYNKGLCDIVFTFSNACAVSWNVVLLVFQ